MKKNITEEPVLSEDPKEMTNFGYELIREDLLPDIFGKDTPEILYWAGKRMARKYPLNTIDEVILFFSRAAWGELLIKSQKGDEMEFELTSPLIISRVKSKSEHFFQLEAGFLAQQIANQKEVSAEAFEHPVKRSQKVQFTVKWDKKDQL